MKKTYMTPEMEVMNIETVEMIATSLVKGGDFVTDGDDVARKRYYDYRKECYGAQN